MERASPPDADRAALRKAVAAAAQVEREDSIALNASTKAELQKRGSIVTALSSLFGRSLAHPSLWCLNRRSVSRAVGIGLFAGLVPGPTQILTALLLGIPLRANLPLAILVTFYTNPFTIVPLYLVAFAYGRFLLQENHHPVTAEPFQMDWSSLGSSIHGLVEWSMAMGRPLAVGLVALALTLGVAGTVAVRLGWRLYVVLAWKKRKKLRASARAGPA